MNVLIRFLIWAAVAVVSLLADILTKAAPHRLVINHYAHTPPIVFILVGLFLCGLALWHSNALSVGCGLMFGGLCGNGGQLLLYGYASDWIPIGGWFTNVADITGGVGLLWCFTTYLLRARPVRKQA